MHKGCAGEGWCGQGYAGERTACTSRKGYAGECMAHIKKGGCR